MRKSVIGGRLRLRAQAERRAGRRGRLVTLATMQASWNSDVALLRQMVDARECACGNERCDGERYRPPYGRSFVACPLRASAQSCAKTASTAASDA
jgi:hypothetical protein